MEPEDLRTTLRIASLSDPPVFRLVEPVGRPRRLLPPACKAPTTFSRRLARVIAALILRLAVEDLGRPRRLGPADNPALLLKASIAVSML